ncbi:MAG: Mu transposase C-terminal domain-containing protein [Rhodocyclaceae bacterium]|nr:Mu transposase C-terminal domain-containing protein [Rhodocyclaceae bacterium]
MLTNMVSQTKPACDFAFERGQILRRGDTIFRIVEERGAFLVLEHSTTLERKVQDMSAVYLEYSKGLIVPSTMEEEQQAFHGVVSTDPTDKVLDGIPIDMLSEAQRRHLRSVLKYISELRRLGYECLRPTPLLRLDYERVRHQMRDAKPPLADLALSTIYEWSLVLDKSGGDARAVVPMFQERGGRGKWRVPQVADAAIRKVFVQLRADTNAKIRACDVEDRVMHIVCMEVGQAQTPLVMPGRSTISRRIKTEFSAYELTRRNKGKALADKEFRTSFPRDRAEWPLEVLEFDDKDSRIFLIDEGTGLPYGRGFVTPGMDQYSRVPMGFSISELPRSAWSAICALTNAILPKDPSAPEYVLVRSPIEFAGKPGIALFDNATYNHVEEIDNAAREIDLTPAWAKPRTPTEKTVVENFNGIMDARFFSTLPGYAGHKSDRAGLVRGTASANMSKEQFEQLLLKWAYDDYCNAPGEEGYTPRQRWHEHTRMVKPRFPLDIYRLKIVPTLRHTVSLRPEGILFTGLIYQNDRLQKLRRTIGAKARVEFRYDPRDMSIVYVFDALARQLFVVPSANLEYTRGLTLYQHRLIRKMARLRRKTNPSIPELQETREELRILVEQSRGSTKKRERMMARRAGNVPGQPPTTDSSPPSSPVEMTDLEAQVADIDDVEMEVGDEGWEVPETI